MQSKVQDEMEETRQQVSRREKARQLVKEERVAEVSLRFAPGKIAGWQFKEEA